MPTPYAQRPGLTRHPLFLTLCSFWLLSSFFLSLVFLSLPVQAAPQAIGLAANLSRLLWRNPDNSAALWNLAADGTSTPHAYPPAATWSPRAVAAAPGNTSRILWTRTDGAMSFWTVDAAGNPSYSPIYGPYSGYAATSTAVGGDGSTRILWTSTGGQFTLWTLSGVQAAPTSTAAYGPFSGWSPVSLAVGADGKPRVLWSSTGGQMTVWTFDTSVSSPVSTAAYGPASGWTATRLACGADNQVRVEWDNTSGQSSYWTFGVSGALSYSAALGPPAGYVPSGIAAGGDGLVRLLWSDGQGDAQVWTVASNGTYTSVTYSTAPSLTAAATGANKVTLYWSGVSGASSYNAYRSTVSGGPYTRIASGAAAADPGPGLTNAFMYSDTAGLATGTEYFYVVTAVQSGAEGAQSNEVSAIPDPSAIAWDTGNAVQIVSQVGTMVANNLASDEPAVGELTIGGPNGVIYQSFQNGNPAQAYAAPGHYSVGNRTLVYADGNEVPAPIDTSDSDPGVPAAASPSVGQSVTAVSATASLKFKQSLGHAYNPTNPPSGIFREVQTQPGYSSFLSYVGLPDVLDNTLSYIDGRKYQSGQPNSSIFPASDTGYIYSGGTAYTTVTGKNGTTTTYKSELDAGLMLFRTGDAAHPGWVPVINPGFKFDSGFVGYPLEYDSAAATAHASPYPQVFVTGEPLMSFKAAGYGTIPDGVVVMSFHAQTDGNVFRLINGIRTQIGDITLVRGGVRGWNRKSQIVIKRMNSIAQNIKLFSTAPGPYAYVPPPNGPGGGFNLAGSFVKGASWGDINADDEAIDGINVFPYGQWDIGLTWQEGSYPVGNPYLGYLVQNQFFWEQYINLHT